MIDTFTGWIEGFPTWTQKDAEVVKKKKKKIKPSQFQFALYKVAVFKCMCYIHSYKKFRKLKHTLQ